MAPMIGMMMSPTSDCTMLLKATPMITPTARSMTLPRKANFLKSSSIDSSAVRSFDLRSSPAKGETSLRRRWIPACARRGGVTALVDQAGVYHRLAHGRSRLVRQLYHRQPYRVRAFAEQRQRVF